jgi:hypothetical protein
MNTKIITELCQLIEETCVRRLSPADNATDESWNNDPLARLRESYNILELDNKLNRPGFRGGSNS